MTATSPPTRLLAVAGTAALAPQDYNTALNDMSQLTAVIPQGKDHPLGMRILAVESSLEAIGKADIGILSQADASQLSAYYASASRLRRYCS